MKIWRRNSSSRSAALPRRSSSAIAQWTGQPAEHAGVDEEVPELLRQIRHDVPGEVLANEPAARADRRENPAPLLGRLAPCRQVEELEPCSPAFSSSGEDGQVVGRNGIEVVVAEQPLHLPGAEPQVVRPDLEQLAGDPESRQVEARREPRADRDRQPGRCVLDEPSERVLGSRALEPVRVIDDKECPVRGLSLERGRRLLYRPPAGSDAGQRRARGQPRGGAGLPLRRRPRSPLDTTRREPPTLRRTPRGASSCRIRRAPRRPRAAAARSSPAGRRGARGGVPWPAERGPWQRRPENPTRRPGWANPSIARAPMPSGNAPTPPSSRPIGLRDRQWCHPGGRRVQPQ